MLPLFHQPDAAAHHYLSLNSLLAVSLKLSTHSTQVSTKQEGSKRNEYATREARGTESIPIIIKRACTCEWYKYKLEELGKARLGIV